MGIYSVNDLSHPLIMECPSKDSKYSAEGIVHHYTFVSKWLTPKSAKVIVRGDYVKQPTGEGPLCSFNEYYQLDTITGESKLLHSNAEP